MKRHFPNIPWRRCADGLLHCHPWQQAHELLEALERRFRKGGLELHPQKVKIVYRKVGKRSDFSEFAVVCRIYFE